MTPRHGRPRTVLASMAGAMLLITACGDGESDEQLRRDLAECERNCLVQQYRGRLCFCQVVPGRAASAVVLPVAPTQPGAMVIMTTAEGVGDEESLSSRSD